MKNLLGQTLKNYRVKRNMTQKEFAEKLGTSQSYYSRVESGQQVPGFRFVKKVSEELNIPESDIRGLL